MMLPTANPLFRFLVLLLVASALCVTVSIPSANAAGEEAKPNLLWIVVEDMSPNFSCYGETTIQTPNVDALAARGTKFDNAFVTCPVCSPSRSAMITGMYQTTIGAHNHRSGRGEWHIQLPETVKTLPEYFREAGYYVTNAPKQAKAKPGALGKTDYNFEYPKDLYDGNDWTKRPEGTPFFAQIQLAGGKNRNVHKSGEIPEDRLVTPSEVTLPPYYPNDPVLLEDWAQYLNSVLWVDEQVGQILQELKDAGVYDNTVVIFLTDHGVSHARGKQFLYEEGIRVPLIIAGPGIEAGKVRTDLVAHIDIAATSLDLAGIPLPDTMEARPLFRDKARPRDYVVSARDRCDETTDHLRSVRTAGYKYIRNFLPERPMLQANRYKDHKEILIRLHELHDSGKLPELSEKLLFAPNRAPEEFYDLEKDPWELTNLADDPGYQDELVRHRKILETWITRTNDQGQFPEPMKAYDSDMAVYLTTRKKGDENARKVLETNIAQQKKWRAEGK